MTHPIHEPPTEDIPSIEAEVQRWLDSEDDRMEALVARLVAREESIADYLRMSGMNFGLYPEIVAEVLASCGFGEPITTEQRVMIHNNFHVLLARLQSEQQGDL